MLTGPLSPIGTPFPTVPRKEFQGAWVGGLSKRELLGHLWTSLAKELTLIDNLERNTLGVVGGTQFLKSDGHRRPLALAFLFFSSLCREPTFSSPVSSAVD